MADAEAPEAGPSVMKKRPREENGHTDTADIPAVAPEDDSDDDVGPMPAPADAAGPPKKRRVLKHEKTAFLLTASADGHVKFWKKQDQKGEDASIEFVKHYRAHLSPVLALVSSADGLVAATIAADSTEGGSCKVFDVENFDMINMLTLNYTPRTCCWIHGHGQATALLAITDANSSNIHIYDGRGDGKPLHTISTVHRTSVHLVSYNEVYDTVVSVDQNAMVEYWSPQEPFEQPKEHGMWDLKSKTDLYEFKKRKSLPTSLVFSPNGQYFATTSLATDRQIRVFTFLTGKLHRAYDETLQATTEMQQAGTAIYRLDDMEFGRRLAGERELEKQPQTAARERAIFDESGSFLIYPTLLGIKFVNLLTNKVSRLLGKDETSRFLDLALFQGSAAKKGLTTVAMAASANPLLQAKAPQDPVLFCTAFKRSRFYLFSRVEPESEKSIDRDVFNEKPTREEQAIASTVPQKALEDRIAHAAVLHTTMGDIHLKLFPAQAPKAVENFVGHSRSGYYDGLLFHRVIAKFMLQTGDPLGDGTGGESIWGANFADEFSPQLKHDRPYTLSMANAGPRTNGSQFFVTTVPCPWLDNKHTIFGRATAGFDTIHAIENVRVDKTDKPEEDIKIVNISIS